MADIFDQIAGVPEATTSVGDIFDQIAVAVRPADRPLSLAEKVMGYSRSYLAGPTFGFGDNIEAALAATLTDKTYGEELSGIRSEQDRFKEKTDYLDNAVEVASGAILNPIGSARNLAKAAQIATNPLAKTISAPVVKTAINAATSVPAQAALSAVGTDNGENPLQAALVGGIAGSALSAAGSVAGNVLENTARGAERLKLSAYGIGSADIAKQLRRLDAQGGAISDASEVPLLKTLDRAEKQGLINAGDDIITNAAGIARKQDTLSSSLGKLLDDADKVVLADKNFPLKNTLAYIDGLSGKAREVAETAANDELIALSNQMQKGTIKELQKLKIGLNYAHDTNPLTANIQKAIRSDLRQAIEDIVSDAADNNLLPSNLSGKVRSLNSEWGELADLRDSFVRRGYKDLQGDVIEDAFGGIRTSGGPGNLNNATATTGNPIWSFIGAGLNAARVPESKSAIADVLSDPVLSTTLKKTGEALPEVMSGRTSAAAYENYQKEAKKPQSLLEKVLQGTSFKSQGDSAMDTTTPPAFEARVDEIAKDLDADPEHLLAVMKFETGGTMDPTIKNKAGSGATGLIQFMPDTAKNLTGENSKEAAIKLLSSMSATEQLDYVKKYLEPFKGKLKTLEDVYMAVLLPRAIGKDNEYALFKKGTTAYWQNKGLDINEDGVVTKAEATSKVRNYKA